MSLSLYKRYKSILLIFSMVIACMLISSVQVIAVEGGGGSSRGGGSGRIAQIPFTTVKNVWEYVQGGIITGRNQHSSYGSYNKVIKIENAHSLNIRVEQKDVLYWMMFYDSNGAEIGRTASSSGYKNVAVPQGSSYVHIVSGINYLSGAIGMVGAVSNLEDNDVESHVWKYNNLWTRYRSSYLIPGYIYNYKYSGTMGSGFANGYQVSTLYPYEVRYGITIRYTITEANKSDRLMLFLMDSDDRLVDYVLLTRNSTDVVEQIYTITNPDVKRMYVTHMLPSTVNNSLIDTLERFTFVFEDSLNNQAVNVEFKDNTYYPTTNNYYYNGSSDSAGWVAGDGSIVVIIDGDGNAVDIGGPSTSVTPSTPGDGEGDNNSGGGIFKGIIDALKGIFGSLGNVLGGLIEILLIPIQFIIDSVADLIGMLRDVLASLGGLGEFFSEIFSFLPSPIPQLFVTFLGAMFVVAIVKMFM